MRRPTLRIIDAHAHAFPDAIAAKAVAALAAEGDIVAHYDGTIDGLLAAMERGGIARTVVAPVATKPSQVCGVNDWMASLGDPRIVPFGAMHPDFPDPDAEVRRMRSLGIRGIKLHSQHQGFTPTDPRMTPVYAAAAEHGLPVLFHAGSYVARHETEAHPAELAAVIDAHSSLTCIMAHMGGYLEWEAVREHLCGRNVYFDTAYVPRNLPDDEFCALIRDHGVERVLFGTDGPWTDAGAEVAYLRAMGLTSDELAAILHDNAVALLGLDG